MAAQSAYAQALRKPAFSLTLPPMLYVSGCSIVGEVQLDAGLAFQDDIERIYVQLQGTMQTKNRMGKDAEQFEIETSDFLRDSTTLWLRERSPPLPTEDGTPVRLPFGLRLPADAPPSFVFETIMNNAYIRYAINVVGVRTGTFAIDRTIRVPIVVLQPDSVGCGIRTQLKLGGQNEWGRLAREMDMRRHPWGEYAHAKMELLVPHIDAFPLFTDVPYTIVFTTRSAPVKRKGTADAPPEKALFPCAPRSPSEIDFELRRAVGMHTPYEPSSPEEHVLDIISKAHAPVPPVDIERGDYLWLPSDGGDRRGASTTTTGRWLQQVSFHSVMNLRVTPTFLTEEIKIKYTLSLRFEFPGLGNVLRTELPISIGSGVQTSLPSDLRHESPRMLDLPSSYWDVSTWAE